MLAVVLTLIFVLFPHEKPGPTKPVLPALDASAQASYLSQIGKDRAASTPSSTYPSSAQSSSAPAASEISGQPGSAPPKVNVASLSLATPANAPAGTADIDSALGGRSYSGSVNVDGYKIPLPPGNWVILSNGRYKSPHATGELVFLGQVKSRRLIGGARVTALRSVGQPGNEFPPKLSGCIGTNNVDLYVNAEAIDAGGHQSCWLIDSFFTPPLQQWADRAIKIGSLERAAAGDLAAKGVTYPQDFVRVRMTRTERWGLLEVSYLFSPETSGIKSSEAISAADTDWSQENVARYPEKVAYVEKTKQWAAQFWPGFKTAFDRSSPK